MVRPFGGLFMLHDKLSNPNAQKGKQPMTPLLTALLLLLAILAVGREHDDRCECHNCRRMRRAVEVSASHVERTR